MTGNKTFDPYETWKSFTNNWEKQANDTIHLWTNSREYVNFSQGASDLQMLFQEIFQKNKQAMAENLQLLTKKDLVNVAKLSIQTEEKLDAIEEQIWNVQDSIESREKEFRSLIEVSHETNKQIKQLKKDQQRIKKDLEKIGQIHFELLELKSELAEMNSLKEEVVSLKTLLAENNPNKDRELALLSK